uniref:Uncharacterized protein n=1 Tax=Amphimedon queenslandica TaxID=400682 RepID=A0A1X7U7S9_AMPQE
IMSLPIFGKSRLMSLHAPSAFPKATRISRMQSSTVSRLKEVPLERTV